jgi:lysyl-tRNA synthetase class 2
MILTVSDLSRSTGLVRVGGRLLSHTACGLILADATSTIDVELRAPPPEVAVHSLVVVEGIAGGTRLTDATIVQAYPVKRGCAVVREHDRLLRQGSGPLLLARAKLMKTIRSWFDSRDFVEVDTPQRVPSPGLDLHLQAFESSGLWLITSPEYQMKRLLAGGLARIYQLVHCFRDGERSSAHNPEFSMLEWYRAFAGIDEVIDDTQDIIGYCAEQLNANTTIRVGDRRIDLKPPYERITVLEAFAKFASLPRTQVLDLVENDEDTYFRRLIDEVEPALAAIDRPVFLTDFPARHASLARLRPSDPQVCERFELYVGGRELCNGFGELTDPDEQRSRLEHDVCQRKLESKPVYPIDEGFLEALVDGMPPSGGNALGIDRLLLLLTGASSIDRVLAFPASWL